MVWSKGANGKSNKRIKNKVKWFKAEIQPAANRDNPDYSYDLWVHDGKRKYAGYFSIVGECFHAYDATLTYPVVKWKYKDISPLKKVKRSLMRLISHG